VAPATSAEAKVLVDGMRYLEALARVRPLDLQADPATRPSSAGSSALGTFWLGSDATADEVATRRAAERRGELRQQVARLRTLLANDAFISRAPAPVVAGERARLADLEGQLAALGEDAD
jgi:valyl-tRNA synthetase